MDSKTACRLSNVDFLAVFTWNPVNALSCVLFAYFVLRMNQKVSDSHVGPDGCEDAMPFIYPSHSLRNPSTYDRITTDVLWSTDLGECAFTAAQIHLELHFLEEIYTKKPCVGRLGEGYALAPWIRQCLVIAHARTENKIECMRVHITGSAVALHCCKAHAKINRKMGNSTPCKIVTPKISS